MKINLNDIIRVKLTDHGKDIYFHQNDDLIKRGVRINRSMPKEDADGYTKFQLWHFMELYGSYIGMAKENVILPLDIYIGESE